MPTSYYRCSTSLGANYVVRISWWWILYVWPASVWGQVVAVQQGHALYEEPFFEASFIQEQHIREVQATVVYKDELLPIQETRTKWSFSFHPTGRLQSHYKLLDNGSWVDSTSVYLSYNESGQVIRRRERDLFGIHYYAYRYDSLDRLIWEKYSRPKVRNVAPVITTYEHQVYADTVTKTRLRHEGEAAFSEVLQRTNRDGILLESTQRYTFGGFYNRSERIFDQSGRVARVIREEREEERTVREYVFQYDGQNRLIAEDVYAEGDSWLAHNEFVYKDALLDAYLSRDEQTQRILIVRFTYSFY